MGGPVSELIGHLFSSAKMATAVAVVALAGSVVAVVVSNFWAQVVMGVALVLLFAAVIAYAAIIGERVTDTPYEVLSLTQEWDIIDAAKPSRKTKTMEVKYLQDNVIAVRDDVWGKAKKREWISCQPGRVVDEFDSGGRVIALISLGRPRNRGETEKFQIVTETTGAFTERDEWVQAEADAPTKEISLKVTFPVTKPPQNVTIESNRKRKRRPVALETEQVGDRHFVSWKARPRRREVFTLRWTW